MGRILFQLVAHKKTPQSLPYQLRLHFLHEHHSFISVL
ncbi:hypothetical protein BCE_2339 [Bacillus cereus ATCC 10987]|uniref:Uncharacterized protein n=1 Tax=Bacillus cereus (strain ATCC 10987 / NRS 248) TaxID=222523 RepID=Q738Q5_BACC1|nr:hypothetical protein BCE_2339 [Bacillus cereus ATCC 10987]